MNSFAFWFFWRLCLSLFKINERSFPKQKWETLEPLRADLLTDLTVNPHSASWDQSHHFQKMESTKRLSGFCVRWCYFLWTTFWRKNCQVFLLPSLPERLMIITGSTHHHGDSAKWHGDRAKWIQYQNHQNFLLTNPVFLRIVVLKNVTCCGEGYTFKFGDF